MADHDNGDISVAGWFGHRSILLEPGEARLGLSDGISIEWKKKDIRAGVPGGVQARPVTQDGIDCVEVTTPAGPGWIRLRIDLPAVTEDTLTGLRVLVRFAPRGDRPVVQPRTGAPLQAFFGRVERAQLHLIEEGMARIAPAPSTWYDLTGAVIRPGGPDRHAAVLNLPEDHVVTLALAETAGSPAQVDGAARAMLDTTGLLALQPLRAARLTSRDARQSAAHPAVFAADATLDGTEVRGWAVTDGPARILLRGAAGQAPVAARTGLTTELRPGLQAECGFVANVLPLVADTATRTVTCHAIAPPDPGRTVASGLDTELNTGLDMPGPKGDAGAIPGPAFAVLSSDAHAHGYADRDPPGDHRSICAGTAPDSPLLPPAPPPPGHRPVLFCAPDSTGLDPYSHLVCRAMRDVDIRPGGLPGAMAHLADPGEDTAPALHLTALGPLLSSCETVTEARAKADELASKLTFLVHQGGQVIWTLRAPPEGPWPAAEQSLGQAVAALGGPLHLHCDSLAAPLAAAWEIDTDPARFIVTPHGGTVGHYPDYAARSVARARLGLTEDAPLFMLFGRLGPGKDIDAAVAAFGRLRAAHPQAHLLILGNTAPGERRGRIRRRFDGLPHVRVIETLTADNSLQWFMRAADWAVMPYRDGHTPAALITAMSFGLPAIAPRHDMIAGIVPADSGLLYDPDAPDGLEQSLFQAISTGPDKARIMGQAARAAMAARDWSATARTLRPHLQKRIPRRIVTLDFDDRPREAFLLGAPFPPERPARTAILILNYDNCDDTARLVASLRRGTDTDFDLYVIDNGSPSVTEDELVQRFGTCHVLRLPTNLGYGAGNNAGLRLVTGLDYRHFLILNPDLSVPPDALERLVAAAEARETPAVFAPALLRGHDPGRVASAGCFLDMTAGLATGHMFAGEPAGLLPDAPFEADFVTGAALFLSRPTLDRVGTLPEDYFLYFEESDWLTRARTAGVPSVVLPDIRLQHHKRSETGDVPAPHFFYYYIRNARVFARRLAARDPAHPDDDAAARARLHSEFITPWLDRIRRAAPERLDWYTDLAERALADAEAGRTGPVDLLAGRLGDPAAPLADPTICAGLRVGFYTGGGQSPKIAGTLSLPAGPAAAGRWTLAAVKGGDVLATAEARPGQADDETAENEARDATPDEPLHLEMPFPKEALVPGRGHTVTLYLNSRKAGSVSAYMPHPPPVHEGRFVALGNYACTGWLRNKANDDRPVEAEIWLDGHCIGHGPADLPVNQGACGFSIRLPRQVSDGTAREFELRAAGSDEVIDTATLSDAIGKKSLLDTRGRRLAEELFYRQEMWFGGLDPETLGAVRHFRDRAARLKADLAPDRAGPVSIAMPVMRGDPPDRVRAAIDSVLAQGHPDWELLIVAEDVRIAGNIADLLGPDPDPRCRAVTPPRTLFTRAEARNLAITMARHPVIAHIEAGHQWDPDFLALQLGALTGKVRAVICGQWLTQKVLGPDGATQIDETVGLRWSQPTLPRLENRPAADISGLVIQRDLLNRLGRFDPALPAFEDWDLMLRMTDVAPPVAVPALLVTSDIGPPVLRRRQDPARRQGLERIAVTADRIASRFGMDDHGPAPAPRDTDIAVLIPDRDAVAGADPGLRIARRLHDVAAALPDPARGRVLALVPPGLADAVRDALADDPVPAEVRSAETGSDPAESGLFPILKAALDWRRDTADLVLLRAAALPLGGMIASLAEAAGRQGDAGILVPRHGIGGRDAQARAHAPSSWRDRDVCIALSHLRGNLEDPTLDLPGSLVAMRVPDPFCLCLLPEVARSMAAADPPPGPSNDAPDLDTLLGDWAAQVCRGLDRRIVYCGRARAFEMPL